MSTQVKAAAALVVLAAIAWVVWSLAFGDVSDVPEEAPPEIEVVQPAPAPKREKVELVKPEPIPEKPAPKPRPKATTTPTADAATAPVPGRVVLPPPQPGPARTVAGIVVDLSGQPTDAHVAVVNVGGGSVSTSTQGGENKGKFEFKDIGPGEYTVQASTKSGQVGFQGNVRIDETQGVAGLTITVEEGATLKITLNGAHDTARCGLTSGGVLIDDFTLRKGKTATNVVPPGMVFLEIYEGTGADRTVYEQRSLSVFSGQENETTFDLQ